MTPPPDTQPEIVEVELVPAAVVREVVEMTALAEFFDSAFGQILATLVAEGIEPIGPPFALYHGQPTDTADLEVGFPVDRAIGTVEPVEPGSTPGGRVARVVHVGAYDELGRSWERLAAWITAQGEEPAADLWEVYLTEPTPGADPAGLRTELNWLLA